MQLSKTISSLWERLIEFEKSRQGQWLIRITRWLFLTAILAWLGYNLYAIGWYEVWRSLPADPLFYLLFLLMYAAAPAAQLLIYRLTWSFDSGKHISPFIKKRILNTEVIGYSGELYFFSWARQYIDLEEKEIAKTIRDYNILSALASNSLSILFLGIFVILGEVQLNKLIGDGSPIYFGVVGVALLILVPLAVKFQEYIFSTPLKMAALVFSIYFVRLAIGIIIQVGMWEIAIPEVSLPTWLTYVAASILVSRIPVSHKKLIFVGVGVEMSASMGIPEAALFGLLASIVALEKVMSFGLFLLFSVIDGNQEYRDQPGDSF